MLAAGSDFSISLAWIMPNTGIHAGLRAVGQHWFQRAAKRIPCRCMESGRAVQFEILSACYPSFESSNWMWIVYIFFREEFPFIGIFFCFCHRCWTAGVRQVSTQLLWNSEILLANDSVANHLQAPPIKGSDFGTMSVGLFGQWGAANHTNIACSRSFGAFAFYIYHPVSARPSIRITTE